MGTVNYAGIDYSDVMDAEIVEYCHQALNRVAAITGTPWREET